VVSGQVAALEEKAKTEGLKPEESAARANRLRTVSGIGSWCEDTLERTKNRLDRMPAEERKALTERFWSAQLGVTVEQLAVLRPAERLDRAR
jgi:hypothetical protein